MFFYKTISWNVKTGKRRIEFSTADDITELGHSFGKVVVFGLFGPTPWRYMYLPATRAEALAWRDEQRQKCKCGPIRSYEYTESVTQWLDGTDTVTKYKYKPNRHAAKHRAAWELAEKLNMGSL